MYSVSNSLAPAHRNSSNLQADQSTNTTDSPRRQNLLKIPELREQIEDNIVGNIKDQKARVAYWLAWTIPTTKDGETFISLPGRFLLGQRLLRHIEEATQQQASYLEESRDKVQRCEDKLVRSKSEEEKQAFREEINALIKKERNYWQKIEGFKSEREACKNEIFRDASLRAFMLKCPPVFDTQDAEKFVYRYEQVAPYLKTSEEYSQALRGFKKVIASGAYTQNSQPSLEKINQKRKEILRDWFDAILCGIEESFWERQYLAPDVRKYLLTDLPQPIQKWENGSINQELSVALRSLAEVPIKEISTALEDLVSKLSSLREPRDFRKRRLVYEAITRYLAPLTEEAAKPILAMLVLEDWKELSDSQQSRILEKLTLYSPIELSNLISESKLIPKLSFSHRISLLKNNSELTYNVTLEILRANVNYIEEKKGAKLLAPFFNYFEEISEYELKSVSKVILELLGDANRISFNTSCFKTKHSYTQFKFSRGCEDSIVDLVERYMKKLPASGVNPLLMGLSNIWLCFSENNLIKLIKLTKKYLSCANKKEEILSKMIENMGDSPTKTKKERSLIIELVAPYLNGGGHEEVPLSTLIILTGKWKDLSEQEQLISINWLEKYLSKNKSQKLIDAIRNNLNYLYKKEARPKAARLLS